MVRDNKAALPPPPPRPRQDSAHVYVVQRRGLDLGLLLEQPQRHQAGADEAVDAILARLRGRGGAQPCCP